MANQGAKKRKEENARHMKNLLYVIIICNAVYFVVRAAIMHSSFKWKHWLGVLLTSLAYALPYQQLNSMSKPTYGESGELIDGGFDMTTTGMCGYLHDIIYITCFVQISSIISDKFWYIYLVIPAFAGYKVFGLVKGFLPMGGEGGMEEDEKSRRKREKLEKRASRGKIVRTKTR